MKVVDPIRFAKELWPDLRFTTYQKEIIYSVRDNDETFVPAGNELGKDFVAGFVALWWFCSRRPARVVTTSVQFDQLNDVLWGEIRGFIDRSKYKLPIQYNHMRIRHLNSDGTVYTTYPSEMVGQCVNKGEALLGRHIPRFDGIDRTLVIFDEASGIQDSTYKSCETWAHRKLIIGNPWPCENFFRRGVEEGNLVATV